MSSAETRLKTFSDLRFFSFICIYIQLINDMMLANGTFYVPFANASEAIFVETCKSQCQFIGKILASICESLKQIEC